MDDVSDAPQTVQERVWAPSDAQVAALVTLHPVQLWPVAEIACVSVCPQRLQVRAIDPFDVQVGFCVVTQSPKLCPSAPDVCSVLVWPQ
jgi:hypothetical protein